jgi:hypothetical protein
VRLSCVPVLCQIGPVRTTWQIISGGQTGVDRAALDAARALGLDYGGYLPKGRRAEDGPLPDAYVGMTETGSSSYGVRTRCNVAVADATLILTRGAADGGTLLTLRTAEERGKPVLCVDLADGPEAVARACASWLRDRPPGILNVAGPRERGRPGIYAEARTVLDRVLAALASGQR